MCESRLRCCTATQHSFQISSTSQPAGDCHSEHFVDRELRNSIPTDGSSLFTCVAVRVALCKWHFLSKKFKLGSTVCEKRTLPLYAEGSPLLLGTNCFQTLLWSLPFKLWTAAVEVPTTQILPLLDQRHCWSGLTAEISRPTPKHGQDGTLAATGKRDPGEHVYTLLALRSGHQQLMPPVLLQATVREYVGQTSGTGAFHGRGRAVFSSGQEYEGQWENGCMHGQGSISWPDGLCYEGSMDMNHVTGSGVSVLPASAPCLAAWFLNLYSSQHTAGFIHDVQQLRWIRCSAESVATLRCGRCIAGAMPYTRERWWMV